ncbi:GNAT family N-acetyltransferase [Pectobacteriaceae bacterium CE70]|uniref:N-acetyltransferase n=1 Tax=Serratia sp. (strain ATCC 39006) TaxID=104623 RepID=A0A2I5TIL5_SERS3|nr:GNAT family N-acetyltransferase [Serratia sp. ATCC 39006]WJV61413.1 GNAT family N-acetyltransferase [Pectobacteriaceae bacterium C52]WJV65684.1 GNAT family N-acetyltransferase [Pectobacteriaceae bacterium CE70]WJY09705.1 GNAT family N-acetyltransferase [Pectobacteriaceae bacterium C80]AUH00090.1 N-acetyltransferase [Serratia sp. ATCC 39006]AUH04409.1 N-acetyltransferase [Serratia sp. ATCC 39006]
MFTISEVKKDSLELKALISELDAFQLPRYPLESAHCIDLSAQDDDAICCLLVRNSDGAAIGCGALLFQDGNAAEIKRVFIKPSCRGVKLGYKIISHLEKVAIVNGCKIVRLETGIYQQSAINLYQNCGYQFCDPFFPYTQDPLSVYMYKCLDKSHR